MGQLTPCSLPGGKHEVCSPHALKDALGREAQNAKSELKVRYADLDSPAPAPRVKLEKSGPSWVWDGSFERNAGGWATESGANDAIVERDSSTAASGQYSLRLTCPANAAP